MAECGMVVEASPASRAVRTFSREPRRHRWRRFPTGFLWGAATASFQIEGARDSRGDSIWDRYCERPGAIARREQRRPRLRPRQPLAHRRRAARAGSAWRLPLLDRLATRAARGRGRASTAGLDFYSRLVDGLLEAGITPYVTLYHWDLPQSLEDAGGWPARATAEAFADYAELVAGHLGDRVRALDDAQRAVLLGRVRLRRRAHGTRPPITCRWLRRRPPPPARSRPRRRADPRRRPVRRGGAGAQPRPGVPGERARRGRRGGAASATGLFNRWYVEPALGLRLPRRHDARSRLGRERRSPTATPP